MTEEAILNFVSKTFRSAWEIELLLVLRQEPRQAWSVNALARELRGSIAGVIQGLDVLERIGFVSIDQSQAYHFQARSAELDEVARELAALYNGKPRVVVRAIYSVPKNRIQTFADAFRLRKDPC